MEVVECQRFLLLLCAKGGLYYIKEPIDDWPGSRLSSRGLGEAKAGSKMGGPGTKTVNLTF